MNLLPPPPEWMGDHVGPLDAFANPLYSHLLAAVDSCRGSANTSEPDPDHVRVAAWYHDKLGGGDRISAMQDVARQYGWISLSTTKTWLTGLYHEPGRVILRGTLVPGLWAVGVAPYYPSPRSVGFQHWYVIRGLNSYESAFAQQQYLHTLIGNGLYNPLGD